MHRLTHIASLPARATTRKPRALLVAAWVASGVLASAAWAQPASDPTAKAARPAPPPASAAASRYRPDRFAGRARKYYELVWGVDSLGVKSVESGEIIRFSYRVLDADKAKVLNSKVAEPSLVAPRSGVSLVVPKMEQIGQLRQSATPEAGKSYWMAFSNKGRLVRPGDRVTVVIGAFRADGLVVD
jgi:hypothetical protein